MDFINGQVQPPVLAGASKAADDWMPIIDKSVRETAGDTTGGVKSTTVDALRQNIVTTYAADGAITIQNGVAKLTKGSAGAYTLAAPTAAQEGTEIKVISGSAFAHVITATNLLDDGVTGGAKDTATFAAFVGAAITLVAMDLKWAVLSRNVVTVAAV